MPQIWPRRSATKSVIAKNPKLNLPWTCHLDKFISHVQFTSNYVLNTSILHTYGHLAHTTRTPHLYHVMVLRGHSADTLEMPFHLGIKLGRCDLEPVWFGLKLHS